MELLPKWEIALNSFSPCWPIPMASQVQEKEWWLEMSIWKNISYIGLISKAADAGYKVVIVVGMLEDLRKQTQIRTEEGFWRRISLQVRV